MNTLSTDQMTQLSGGKTSPWGLPALPAPKPVKPIHCIQYDPFQITALSLGVGTALSAGLSIAFPKCDDYVTTH